MGYIPFLIISKIKGYFNDVDLKDSRDNGEISIFDVFLGIKIALGFKYVF